MPTFYQRFQESARKFPDNIALEIQRQQTVERVTFAELTRMSESVANWLSTRVPRDARVAILAANHPRWVAAYLGIIAAGRTAVPLDTAFHADQVKKLLIDSGASLLFCDVKHLPVAAEAVEGTNVGLVMTSAASERDATAPNPTHGLTAPDTGNLATDLDSIFAAGPAGFQPVVPAESDLAALLYTSGTTADPKGVMLTHANLVGEANAVFAVVKIGPTDALLGILPDVSRAGADGESVPASVQWRARRLPGNAEHDRTAARFAGTGHHRILRRAAVFLPDSRTHFQRTRTNAASLRCGWCAH